MVSRSPERTAPSRLRTLSWLAACGLTLGLLHILPATGLTSAWISAVRILGTIYVIAAIYRHWQHLNSIWASLAAGIVTGLFYFGIALYWLGSSANPDPTSFIPREILLTSGALCLFFPWWGAWFAAASLLRKLGRDRPGIAALAFTTAFSGANVLMGDHVFGLPMAPISIAAADTPLIRLLPFVGQFGLDAIIVAAGALSGALWGHHRSWWGLAVPAAAYAACGALGPLGSTGDTSPGTVYLGQPSLPHVSLLPPDQVESIIVHTELRDQIDAGIEQGAALIVLPEGAFMEDLSARPEIVQMISARLTGDQQVLAGFPRIEMDAESHTVRPYNSAMLIGANGPLAIIDKAHLVPFGETMPQLFFGMGFDVVAGPAGGYGSADAISVVHQAPGNLPPYALVICYEAMLSGPVARETDGARWLLNISAEGLFRGTIGPRLLLEYVRLRAIETGLPVLRATAHAYSGLIAPDGTVQQELAAETHGGVLARVPSPRVTAFRNLGYSPLYTAMALAVVVIFAVGAFVTGTRNLRAFGKFPKID